MWPLLVATCVMGIGLRVVVWHGSALFAGLLDFG